MRGLILAALLSAAVTPAIAANFSGRWTMEVEDRPGRSVPVILDLNQVGGEVSGSALSRTRSSSGSPAGVEIHDGEADGDTLSFYVWIGRDRPMKRVYRGRLSGDEIRFTVTGWPVRFDERGRRIEPPGPQEVTARRTR